MTKEGKDNLNVKKIAVIDYLLTLDPNIIVF